MRLYIIRHADPDYPNKTITPAGHLEAEALARRLEGENLDKIYVSPLGRARHTMQYTADRLGMRYEVQDWVQEIGEFRIDREKYGRSVAWNADGEVMRRRPLPTESDWHTREPFDDPNFVNVYNRVRDDSDAFVASHGYRREDGAYRIENGNRDRIAVFCHAGFGLTWLAHLLDLPLTLAWSGFFMAPSSVTIVLFDERSEDFAVPRCLCVGDTSHLYEAGLPVQPAGIVANCD